MLGRSGTGEASTEGMPAVTAPREDPWVANTGALAPPARRRRGPAGCVLGAMAFLLICGVAGTLVWLIARPYLRDAARDELREGVAAEVGAIDAADLPVLPSGDLVVTEEEMNEHLRANAGAYDPLEDPIVTVDPDRMRVRFSLYGTTSTYSGRPDVRNGALVVEDGDLDGAAGRVLDADDVSAVIEEQLAALLARSGLRPTGVRLRDGALTITTVPAQTTGG